MLEIGNIDIILENDLVAKFHHKLHKVKGKYELQIVGKDVVNSGLYICWTRKKPELKKIMDDFDKAIQTMKKDGSIEKIKNDFGMN